MVETVTLREITEKTVRPVCRLSETLSPSHKKMVADNAVSIAEAHYSPYAWYRAIYADETPVGFIMIYIGPEDEEHGKLDTVYFLWRLMVAGPHQGKGYGRRAVELLMEKVKTEGATELLVSCGEGEGSPEGFYRTLGFERTGDVLDDEVVMKRSL